MSFLQGILKPNGTKVFLRDNVPNFSKEIPPWVEYSVKTLFEMKALTPEEMKVYLPSPKAHRNNRSFVWSIFSILHKSKSRFYYNEVYNKRMQDKKVVK